MSPLARTLLALACAALLRAAACADENCDHCITISIGNTNEYTHVETLPTVPVKLGQVEIPVVMHDPFIIVGQTVSVCADIGVPPFVVSPPRGFSPVEVKSIQLYDQEYVMIVAQYYNVIN